MAAPPVNIYPIFDQLMPRASKESLLGQRAKVIWMTGLSGSGKSTIAKGLEKSLQEHGILCMVLDGDNVRAGINNNLGFSDADRTENIRRIAEVAKLFLQCGVVTICCFVSPTQEIRNLARQIIGPEDFMEVFVNTPIEECERRDVKGLYAKARAGEIKDFTGINAPFEAPENPEVNLLTAGKSPEQSTADLLGRLLPQIKIK
jgi:adenylylsulfate kinase